MRTNLALKDQVILLPGASGGIGLEVLDLLLDEGACVVAGCHAHPGKVSERIRERGVEKRVSIVEGELHLSSVRQNMLQEALRWGRIDGLVDCSGIACRTPLDQIQEDELAQVFLINSLAPLLLARDVATEMTRLQSRGSIVHLSSQHAPLLTAGKEIYALSKRVLSDFNRVLARQFPSIRLNEIVLGAVGIGMSAATKTNYRDSLVSLDDLKSAILYLLDPKRSSGITGSSLRLDRGFSLPYQ